MQNTKLFTGIDRPSSGIGGPLIVAAVSRPGCMLSPRRSHVMRG
jgi:hypothetical protein